MSRTPKLNGSAKHAHPHKVCSRCETPSEPTNGVQMSANRWFCMGCWIKWKANK